MRILLVLLFTVSTFLAHAQGTTPGERPSPQTPVMDVQEQMRALSGELKDLHGQIHQRQGAIEKYLMNATDQTRIRLTQLRDELDAARTEIENSLAEVNSNDEENWPEIRMRAGDVRDRAAVTLQKAKETTLSAVN